MIYHKALLLKILIAEDDPSSRLLLKTTLEKWEHDVVATSDGRAAWEVLEQDEAPSLAILDWMMPGFDGVELCRRIREAPALRRMYVILLTAKSNKDDIVIGLQSGADDYIIKPFYREELRARMNVGVRVVELQEDLAKRVRDLEIALSNVNQLQGLLPICSYCKKIRDDSNYWQQVENYIGSHSEARFSHSVCPECYEVHIEPQINKLRSELGNRAK